MITITKTYTDFNGNERTEEFFFHLSQAETIKWLTTSGDYTLDKMIERLATERNGKKIMEIFEDLIHRSYGRPSIDGRRFEKSEEIWRDFFETEAYSKIFTELVTDAKKASAFVSGILPKQLTEEINKIVAANPEGVPDALKDYMSPMVYNPA